MFRTKAEFDSLPVSASPPSLLTMRNMVGDFEGARRMDEAEKALEILEDFQKWLEEESAKLNVAESSLSEWIKNALIG